MLARMFPVFVALFLVVAIVGCEGETGPAGPAGTAGQDGQDGQDGQPGPAVILAFGVIDGNFNPPVVNLSWPSAVTVTINDISTGMWAVTLAGTFPNTQGALLVSNTQSNAARSMTGFITTWSSTQIVFRVAAFDVVIGRFEDIVFSYVVLGE